MSGTPTDGTREQLFRITLTVNGVDYGVWDKWDWGGKDTDMVQYRSGGSPDQENLGGPTNYADLTITRNYRLSRDASVIGPLFDACGILPATATRQPLDRSYNASGPATQLAGVCRTFVDSQSDSTSTDPATIALTIAVNSIVVK